VRRIQDKESTQSRNKRWYHKCLGILTFQSIWTPPHSLRRELSAKIEIFRKPSVMQPFVVPGVKKECQPVDHDSFPSTFPPFPRTDPRTLMLPKVEIRSTGPIETPIKQTLFLPPPKPSLRNKRVGNAVTMKSETHSLICHSKAFTAPHPAMQTQPNPNPMKYFPLLLVFSLPFSLR
jgi:hypothetical protein